MITLEKIVKNFKTTFNRLVIRYLDVIGMIRS